MMRRYLQLSAAERRDLPAAAWRLFVVRLLLPFGIQRCARWLDGFRPGAGVEADIEPWQRRAAALKRLGARLPGTACLVRSLALRWWMRSAGLDARIRIGARPGEDGVAAHAWVELDGVPVDDHADHIARFRVILSA